MIKLSQIENNKLTARNILVKGDVHISGDLKYVDDPDIPEVRKIYENMSESITVTGDLYILTDRVDCQEAVSYANLNHYDVNNSVIIDNDNYFNLNVKKPETFNKNMNKSSKNVYFDAKNVKLYGKLVCEGNVSVYSDKVFNRIRNMKIKRLKSTIKK
jgi:hypothetical protein